MQGSTFKIFLILTQGHFLKLILVKEEVREERRERNINWLPPLSVQTGDQTRNLGMYPDWESNPQLFGYRMTF